MANESDRDARLAILLAAYGRDVTRWPAHELARLDGYTSEARAVAFRDDAALDQLLREHRDAADRAPPSTALMARIMASVPVAGARDAEPSPSRRPGIQPFRQPTIRRVPALGSPIGQWRAAAALMAASLVLGIFIGSTAPGQATARSIGEIAGIGFAGPPIQTSGLDDAFSANDDEDIL